MQDFSEFPEASASRRVSASAVAIWQVLSELGGLAAWAPGIDGVNILPGVDAGVGAVRQVKTAQFGTIDHHITVWEPERHFAYETADSGPFSRTMTRYGIVSTNNNSADVSVTITFELKHGGMDIDQAREVLTKGLEATLQALELRARMADAKA